ncbi:glucans biosynthesis glucosyltransferase MdoH [Bradyrhizobium prioriisuperbiae]|uniref:glucans biosynthesis glucosyltransferase MdoH n=1 Tax=Bradyrhizobium prioriisuperbiae TaxID=2854389 RepID=UPI0028F074F8|nr:glucans biosynthesis glucosyltransferase MdoH [Bradyrhizobium prioritasuperba]
MKEKSFPLVLEQTAPQAIQNHVADKSVLARRVMFALLFVVTIAVSLWLAVLTLAPGGFGLLDCVALMLFAVTLPWMVAGFWNAVIGFVLLRSAMDPAVAVLPAEARIRGDEAVTASTAILLCIRNELPDRILRNLEPMLAGLDASGYGGRFHLYVLSDSDSADVAAREEEHFAALAQRWRDRIEITYRRRTVNTGYKAGNVFDFCERWGRDHEFAVTLDADSFMTANAILRLVRIMQADPRLGILQGLIVGLPSTSLFARIFQFGMRLGMRSYTVGSAWWQSDCGPYWGHNAVLRLDPFMTHCRLPLLSTDGEEERHILSHDQIEAALMRSAGYHVRVVAQEDLGWEENPPTLLEFMRRDLRWCEGNMQYWPFLSLPNLRPVSRYQLVLAILMFIGSPAWIGLLGLATIALALCDTPASIIRADVGSVLFAWILAMWFAPKIASAVDILLRPHARHAFGGAGRFLVNFAIETVYSLLLCPILWISHTIFLLGLLFNREIGWIGQVRDDHAVPLTLAFRNLWPQTLIGWAAIGAVAATQPAALPYILLLAAGPALAVPFAMVTSWPRLGALAARIGVGRLPEETTTPQDLLALSLPALQSAVRPVVPTSV